MPSALFVTTVDITLEAFLLPFADHLRANGWRVDAASRGATANEHIADHFDALLDVGWTRSPLSAGSLTSARRIREVVAAGGYDLVWVHTPIAAFMTRLALRRIPARPAIIYTAHGFHFYRGGDALPNLLYRTMERLAARWTDYLVTINREDFDAAKSFSAIPSERVRLIPGIGVDTQRFRPDTVGEDHRVALRAALELDPDDVAIVMVAELAPVKRHSFALGALSLVKSSRVKLVLVGTGPLEADVRSKIRSLHLEDRVTMAGYRRDLTDLLPSMDALLLCSQREGLARSVLEAMAAGLPILGTDTRGIADAADDGAGWVTPKNDPVALAAAMDALASDANERARRGTRARERATTEFDVTRVIAAYDELFAEALGENGRRSP